MLEVGEGCDDGNTISNDGCSATCLLEVGQTCNDDTNGAVDNAGCESGVCDSSGGLPGTCEAALTCGNSVLEA